MPATPVAVTTLVAYLKSGKDLRKNTKTLLRHLSDVYNGSSDAAWSGDIPESFIDSLLMEVLVQLDGGSSIERDCIRLIHVICCKALRPAQWRSISLVPMFLHDRHAVDRSSNGSGPADAWVKNLIEFEIEKHTEDYFRRCLALRTAGAIAEAGKVSSASKRKLGEICRGVLLNESMLIRISAPPQAETGNGTGPAGMILRPFRRATSTGSNFNALDKDTERNFIALCEACLVCARKTLPDSGPLLYEDLSVALGAVRGEICRLAMAFFLKACQYDIDRVAREFSFRLPATAGTIELNDTMATRDFAKILLCLTSGPTDKAFHALALLIRDNRPSVYLLVCSLLAELPWQWLSTHVLPARQDELKSDREKRQSASGRAKLVPEIVYRLSEALKSSRSTVHLAACEAVGLLGRSRCIWVAEDPISRRLESDPFFALSGKVTSLCFDSNNDAIRSAAAVALAWVGKPLVLAKKLTSTARLEQGSDRVIEAALERCERSASADMCDALFALLWHYRTFVDSPGTLAQQIFAIGLIHARLSAFKALLSFLDWANDAQNVAWEVALLGVVSGMEVVPNRSTASRLIIRLERVLRFSSSWLCRKEAAIALVKLAVIVGEPVRIQVYEILTDFDTFATSTKCYEKDFEIRTDIVAPAVALFDDLYELFARREQDQLAYEMVNKRVLTLCSGLSNGFSFLAQAREQLGMISDNDSEDDNDQYEASKKSSNKQGTAIQMKRGNISQQRRRQFEESDEDEDSDDEDEETTFSARAVHQHRHHEHVREEDEHTDGEDEEQSDEEDGAETGNDDEDEHETADF